jgi:hypothetical protein
VNAELSRAWIPLKPEHRWAIEMQKQKRQLFTAIALETLPRPASRLWCVPVPRGGALHRQPLGIHAIAATSAGAKADRD